jgi:mono/diheme cytochrome c family protein
MKTIPRWTPSVLIILASALLLGSHIFSRANAAAAEPQKNAAPAQQSSVERGKYLVENVAMCVECHTPRDDNGQVDNSRMLQGASNWLMPVHPTTNWASRAPALAGFPGITDEQGEDILERGRGPNGLAIQPPMHIYHMNHADATAIIAYLKSLPSAYPRE